MLGRMRDSFTGVSPSPVASRHPLPEGEGTLDEISAFVVQSPLQRNREGVAFKGESFFFAGLAVRRMGMAPKIIAKPAAHPGPSPAVRDLP